MATTSTTVGRSIGYRQGRRFAIGAVIVALLAGLTILSIRTSESTDLEAQPAQSLTMTKADALETVGGAAAAVPAVESLTMIKAGTLETASGAAAFSAPRVPHSEFKLSQVAGMGLAAGAAGLESDDYSRLKLEQMKGQPVEIPVSPNLVE